MSSPGSPGSSVVQQRVQAVIDLRGRLPVEPGTHCYAASTAKARA